MWMDQEMLDIISAFIDESGLDHTFIKIGHSSDQKVLPPREEIMISNKYDGCVIPLHEWLFSLIGFNILFQKFRMDVLNHLVISHSQLHPVSWAYIKVFHYLCKYKKYVLSLVKLHSSSMSPFSFYCFPIWVYNILFYLLHFCILIHYVNLSTLLLQHCYCNNMLYSYSFAQLWLFKSLYL